MSSLTTTDRLKELLPQLFNTERTEGDYYLKFQLTDTISGLIDLKYVQESLIINGDRITPIPNLPEYVVGLMSWRNQVFLAIDLAHLIGLSPETVNLRQYQTIIVRDKKFKSNSQPEEAKLFALTVKRIEGIARILPQDLGEVAEDIPDLLRSFVITAVQKKGDRIISSNRDFKYSFLIDIARLIAAKTTVDSPTL